MNVGLFRTSRFLLACSTLFIGVFLATLFLKTTPVEAGTGINQEINFQGRLLNSQGATVPDGYYNIEFKIYQDGDGQSVGDTTGSPAGSLKWTEDYLNYNGQGVKVVNGYLSVELGSVNPFGSSINWNESTLWLSMNIGGTGSCSTFSSCSPDGEMTPMQSLTSAVYSLNSNELDGLTASSFAQLSANQTWTGSNIFQTTTDSATALQVANTYGAVQINVNNSASNNLLSYPGFESGSFTNGSLGWVATSPGSISQNANPAHTYDGIDSLDLTTTSSNGGISTYSFTQTISPGTYYVSFYVMPGTAMNANAFTINLYDGNNHTCTPSSQTLSTTSFTRVSCSATITNNLSSLSITQNDSTARSAIYIDDAQLQSGSLTDYQTGTIQLPGTTITSPSIFQNASNSTTAFQIQDTSGTDLLVADTADDYVGIGTSTTPGALLSVGGTSGNFQVNSSGAITTGGNLTFSGSAARTITGPGAGGLSLSDTTGAIGITGGAASTWDIGNYTLSLQTTNNGAITTGTGLLTVGGNLTFSGSAARTITGPGAGGLSLSDTTGAIGITGGAASTWDIGNYTLSLQTTNNGAITTGTGLLTVGGNLTFSGTTARTITGPSTGGLTITVGSGPLALSTTTSGAFSVNSAAALNLTGNGNSSWDVGANTLSIQATNNGAINTGTGQFTHGGNVLFSGTAARTITGPSTGGLTITVGSGPLALSTTTSGALSVSSAGSLNLTGAAASTWDIGNNTLSIQTNSNGAITTGSGLFTEGGNLTFSGTNARTITGPSTGGLTITVGSGPLALSTTTSGALSVSSAGSLNLTGAAASTWDIGNYTLSLQTTNNGAITTGTGLLTVGGNLTFSGSAARTITGPGAGGLSLSDTTGAIGITGGAASTWDIGNYTLSLQTTNNGAITTGTGLLTVGGNLTFSGSAARTITGPGAGGLSLSDTTGAIGITGGAASTWDIGNYTLSLQTTNNGAITTGTGLLTVGGNLTFSGTTARTITGPSTGGLTITVGSGPLALSTTTSGAFSVNSAAALNLTGNGNSSWDVGANTLSIQATNNGAINTGTGQFTHGGNVLFSGTAARTITGPSTGGLTITVGSGPLALSTTTSGALSVSSAGSLNLTGAAASTWDIGNNTLSIQTNSNGAITTGSGLFTEGGNLTFSGTNARTITGPSTGGLTITVGSGPLALSTTTSGALSVSSAGSLNLTGAAASTWDIGNYTLSLQTTNNGAITTGTGLLTVGGNLTFSGSAARTITGPGAGGLSLSDTTGAIGITGGAASTWDIGNYTLSLQTTNNGAITTGTGLLTVGGNLTFSGSAARTITGPGAGGLSLSDTTGAIGITGGAASTWDIGNYTLSLQTTNNGAITTGTGLLTVGGNLTFSGTTARTITGPSTGGLTITVGSGPLALSTTTSGAFSVNSAAALNLTGNGNSSWDVGANTLSIQATNNGAINTGTGQFTHGGNVLFSGTAARTITGPSTGGLTITVGSGPLALSTTTSGALSVSSAGSLNLTGAAASTWDIGNNTLSIQTTSNGAITTGTGLLTVGGNLTFSGATPVIGASTTNAGITIQGNGTGTLNLNTTGAGTVDLGTANSTTIGVGNTTAATQTLIQGGTGTSALSLQVGIGGTISVGTTAQTNALDLGNNSSSAATLIEGGTTSTAIQLLQGTGGTVVVGGTGSGSTVSVQCGAGTSSTCGFANNATDHSTTIGSNTGSSLTTIQGGTSGINLNGNITSTGNMTTIGNNELIGDLNTPFGGLGTYANLLIQSEAFDSATWTKTNVTNPTANTVVAPDGNTTAESLADSSTGGSVSQISSTAPTNASYTFSVWLKSSGSQTVNLRIDGSTGGTGTTTTVTATTTWQRFSVTQNTNGFGGFIKVLIFPGGTGGSGTVSAWGTQLVLGSAPETYINTVGSTVSSTDGLIDDGNAIFQSATNSSTAFQIQNSSSYDVLALDTSGDQLKIFDGTSTQAYIAISYNDGTSTGTIAASTGTTAVGNGTGPINITAGSGGAVSITANTTSLWRTTAGTLTLESGTSSGLILTSGSGQVSVSGSSMFTVGSSSSDPTCNVGSVVYNTSTNTLRGCQGTTPTWNDLINLSIPTLQQTYQASTGGSTPELLLNSTQGGLDIQDANTTIGSDLLDVRSSSSGGLGTALLSVGNTGTTTLSSSGGTNLLTADSVNDIIQIGSSSAHSANPITLGLDAYQPVEGSGEPNESDGAMYYDADSNDFRCGVNGFWQSCDIDNIASSFVFQDEFLSGYATAATGTSFQNVGDLGWNVNATTSCSAAYNQTGPPETHDHPGTLRLGAGAANGDGCAMTQGGTAAGTPTLSEILDVGDTFKTNIAISAQTGTMRVGWTNETSNTAPTSGAWWEYNHGSNTTNLRYCYANNTTAVCATGPTFSANTWAELEIHINASNNITFVSNIGGTTNTYTTTGTFDEGNTNKLGPTATCYASTTTAVNCFVDYIQWSGYDTSGDNIRD